MISRQTHTPQKQFLKSSKKAYLDQFFTRDLFSPCNTSFLMVPTLNTHRKQPDYLLSPSPIKKDLFAQLLGTEVKHNSLTFEENEIVEQSNDYEFEDSSSEMNNEDEENSNEDLESDGEQHWVDDNELRKRKRKSTVQIKLLKQELDVQENWNKENIVKMAKLTGLSQSQVYKWFWDQKKKNKVKQVKGNNFRRRRMICKQRKNFNQLEQCHEKTHKYIQESCQYDNIDNGKQNEGSLNNETEKKIKKRLVFH